MTLTTRKEWFRHSKGEVAIYALIWVIVYTAPLVSELIHDRIYEETTFNWSHVFSAWMPITNFLIAFVIHDLFIAPILISRRRTGLYVAIVTVFILSLVYISSLYRPERPPMPAPAAAGTTMPPPPKGHGTPPEFFGRHDIVYFMLLVLGAGMNLGTKNYFAWRDERKRLEAIEQKSLKQQLDYLRYQVNPHFLMNTLNNIHALVDIDSDKAKRSIVMLSRMMRYLLYEGAQPTTTLQQAIDFTKYYVALMRMRYDDNVHIELDLPEQAPVRHFAPLLFANYIENAFKHGVSYNQPSFIKISIRYDAPSERVIFYCVNTVLPSDEDRHGGVGLENTRQRLDLLYGDRYDFEIREHDNLYEVTLAVPTTAERPTEAHTDENE